MPKRSRAIDIRWPMAGLHRRRAYRQQPPFTTMDCRNVRPDAVHEGRQRGGSRPGVSKAFQEELGSGTAVRMLDDVESFGTYKTGAWYTFYDDFSDPPDQLNTDLWDAASWAADGLPGVIPDENAVCESLADVGAVLTFPMEDGTLNRRIILDLVPYQGRYWGKFRVYFGLDETTPLLTADGVMVEVSLTGTTGVYSGGIYVYQAGVLETTALSSGSLGYAPYGELIVDISSTESVTVTLFGKVIANGVNLSGKVTPKRMGFGMECTTVDGKCLVDTFTYEEFRSGSVERFVRRMLVASAGGELWREVKSGTLSLLTTNLTLNNDRRIVSAERGGKLYLADWGPEKASSTTGKVNNAANNDRLLDVNEGDFTDNDISVYDDVVVIHDPDTANVTAGVWQIKSINAGYIETTTPISTGGGVTNFSYYVCRGPKIFDPVADTLTLWIPTTGAVPVNCPTICRYRDRLALAGAWREPTLWYMSRLGDPLDFDYSQEDAGAAVSGTAAEAGKVGEAILALVPHVDDFMLIGCEHSLWVMRGDPTYGGQIDALSHNIGIIAAKAWCYGPNGETFFLSRDGLYVVPPGATSVPQSISRERCPRELTQLDTTQYHVELIYDVTDRGVHIYTTRQP